MHRNDSYPKVSGWSKDASVEKDHFWHKWFLFVSDALKQRLYWKGCILDYSCTSYITTTAKQSPSKIASYVVTINLLTIVLRNAQGRQRHFKQEIHTQRDFVQRTIYNILVFDIRERDIVKVKVTSKNLYARWKGVRCTYNIDTSQKGGHQSPCHVISSFKHGRVQLLTSPKENWNETSEYYHPIESCSQFF